MRETIDTAKQLTCAMMRLDNEPEFLSAFLACQHQLLDGDGKIFRTLFQDLIQHAVRSNWVDATQAVYEWGKTQYMEVWLWRDGLLGVTTPKMCDWFIDQTNNIDMDRRTVLGLGTNDLVTTCTPEVLAHWIEQCMQLYPKTEFGGAVTKACLHGRLDNAVEFLPWMRPQDIASAAFSVAAHGLMEAVDVLYDPGLRDEISKLVEIYLMQNGETKDGIVYLQQKIQSDADRLVIAAAMDEHLGALSKGRKL